MTASELIEAGERLFGEHWKQPLAEALDCNVTTVRRWAAAEYAMPKTVAMAIRWMLEKHQQEEASK